MGVCMVYACTKICIFGWDHSVSLSFSLPRFEAIFDYLFNFDGKNSTWKCIFNNIITCDVSNIIHIALDFDRTGSIHACWQHTMKTQINPYNYSTKKSATTARCCHLPSQFFLIFLQFSFSFSYSHLECEYKWESQVCLSAFGKVRRRFAFGIHKLTTKRWQTHTHRVRGRHTLTYFMTIDVEFNFKRTHVSCIQFWNA